MSIAQKIIGENIRAARLAKEMTQKELASKVHVDQQYISKLEQGKAMPSIPVLNDIAKVLEVSFMELIRDENNQYRVFVDMTNSYRKRMEQEEPEVQEVMKRALESGAGKIIVEISISESEVEILNSYADSNENAEGFWHFIDPKAYQSVLDTPAQYVKMCRKDEECGEDRSKFRKWLFEQYFSDKTFSKGFARNTSIASLSTEDSINLWRMLGIISKQEQKRLLTKIKEIIASRTV